MAQSPTFNWQDTCQELARNRLSVKCFREMGDRFDDPAVGELYTLASKLGVGQKEMTSIATCQNRGEKVLKIWANRPDTTVYVLYSIFRDMNRSDVIGKLHAELTDPVDLVISVKDEDANEPISLYHPKAHVGDTVMDVIRNIPGIQKIPKEKLVCVMESAPTNIWDSKASEFQGKQIQLEVDNTQFRSRANTEPQRRAAVQKTARAAQSVPTSKLPIQATGSSEAQYESLTLRSGTVTQSSRREPRTRIELPPNGTVHDSKRESADSGYGARGSRDCDRQSMENNHSYQEINPCSDPPNRLDRISLGDESTLTPEQMPTDDYLTVPGALGRHLDCISTEQIYSVLKPHIEKDGSYFFRHSREIPDQYSVSVVFRNSIVNYRIRECANEKSPYYFYTDGPFFPTITNLIQHYERNEMKFPDEHDGPILRYCV